MSMKNSTVGRKEYKKLSESTLEILNKEKNSIKKSIKIDEDEKEDQVNESRKSPRKKNITVINTEQGNLIILFLR